jgi:hypothetical protein
MQVSISKLLSLMIALAYAVLLVVTQGGLTETAFKSCAVLLLPLALIWFPDELGSMTGYIGRGGNIDTETPPILVSLMGWFFLVGLPVLFYFLS